MQTAMSSHFLTRHRSRSLALLVAISLALLWRSPQAAATECNLQLSENELDYGRITRSEIADGALTHVNLPLNKRHVALTAICPQVTEMTLFFRAPATDADSFRLADGGSFTVHIERALLDGKPVSLGDIRAIGESPLRVGNGMLLRPDHGAQLFADGHAAKGSQLSLQLVIQPRINAAASKRRDEITWYEQGVFEMVTP